MIVMKDKYFSHETIRAQAAEMLAQIGRYKRHRIPLNMAKKSALIVLDMQDYFLDPSSHAYLPSTSAIIPGLQKLISAYLSSGLPVYLTQHINSSQDAGMLGEWWADVITEENPLSRLSSKIPSKEAEIIRKSQYDAFYKTNLEDLLIRESISLIVICGVMTHLCCETTARSAFVRGFEVLFTVDGTATQNKDFHMAALLNLSHGFATPVLVDEILTSLQSNV